jgi:hypothetical protein
LKKEAKNFSDYPQSSAGAPLAKAALPNEALKPQMNADER